MPTSTPPFRFRSPMCRRFFAAYHGSMPRLPRRPAETRRGKSAQLGMRRGCVCPTGTAETGLASALRKERKGDASKMLARRTGSYDAENDMRASRTLRYWRWLTGTASLQSMTSPSLEAWTTCSMFAR